MKYRLYDEISATYNKTGGKYYLNKEEYIGCYKKMKDREWLK